MKLIQKEFGNNENELLNVYESEVIDAFLLDNLEEDTVRSDLQNLSCYTQLKLRRSGIDEYDYEIIAIQDDENFEKIEQLLEDYEKELIKEL